MDKQKIEKNIYQIFGEGKSLTLKILGKQSPKTDL